MRTDSCGPRDPSLRADQLLIECALARSRRRGCWYGASVAASIAPVSIRFAGNDRGITAKERHRTDLPMPEFAAQPCSFIMSRFVWPDRHSEGRKLACIGMGGVS